MTPDTPPTPNEPAFSVGRSIKLGTFHIGSSLTDLLTSAVWNRIMISDLGIVAWPVSLLSALRYFLAPLTLWVGHRSDTRPILGSHRTAYIWLGRLLMLASLPLLPLATVQFARHGSTAAGWLLAFASFLLYGCGTLLSGAPFLALVHDSAPYTRRGQVVSIVQFILIASFAFVPLFYARLMPHYDEAAFVRLVMIGLVGAAVIWVLSILGEERRRVAPVVAAERAAPSFRATFRAIWSDLRTRRYALFLGGSAFFAFMQDAILEPFGGDVFGLPAGETTRFNAYWGTGVLISMVLAIVLTRKRRPDQQVPTTGWGLGVLAAGVLLLAVTALAQSERMIAPVLVLFGIGFGIFTVGGFSLLMAVNTEEQAGSYLALWTVIQLVSRGSGIAMGGVLRDIAFSLSASHATAYAAVFIIEGLGLLACILLLRRVDVAGFVQRRAVQPTMADALAVVD